MRDWPKSTLVKNLAIHKIKMSYSQVEYIFEGRLFETLAVKRIERSAAIARKTAFVNRINDELANSHLPIFFEREWAGNVLTIRWDWDNSDAKLQTMLAYFLQSFPEQRCEEKVLGYEYTGTPIPAHQYPTHKEYNFEGGAKKRSPKKRSPSMSALEKAVKAKYAKIDRSLENGLEDQEVFRMFNLRELRALAKIHKVKNYSKLNRSDLEAHIHRNW